MQEYRFRPDRIQRTLNTHCDPSLKYEMPATEMMTGSNEPKKIDGSPVRVAMIRCVSGAGGGADKIILRTAAIANPEHLKISILVIHGSRDIEFDYPQRAERTRADFFSVPQRWPFDPRVSHALEKIVDAGDFDILHSHDYKADYYASRLGARLGIPIVATAHGWTGSTFRERRIYYPANKRLLKRFDAVICVSSDIRNELISHGASKESLHVILNGLDPASYQRSEAIRDTVRKELSLSPESVVIASVGRVERQKRFDLLIDAFAKLARNRPELQLLIVGTGSLLGDHQRQVEKLGLTGRCHLLGHRSDMKRLYQAFDIYAQSSDYEGTPTVLLEAMAMKLPIVATDAGGTTELIEPDADALVVPIGQPQLLAEALETTIDDPVMTRERVANASAKLADKLSMERRTSRLHSVYSDLLCRADNIS